MILKWIHNVILGPSEIGRGDTSPLALSRKTKDNELLDVVHEVMRKDAEDLKGLVNLGQPVVYRKKLKEKIKKKVRKVVVPELNDDDIIEEVTERILDAAEFDPYYREMFEDK